MMQIQRIGQYWNTASGSRKFHGQWDIPWVVIANWTNEPMHNAAGPSAQIMLPNKCSHFDPDE
jgi:hypothetical protein